MPNLSSFDDTAADALAALDIFDGAADEAAAELGLFTDADAGEQGDQDDGDDGSSPPDDADVDEGDEDLEDLDDDFEDDDLDDEDEDDEDGDEDGNTFTPVQLKVRGETIEVADLDTLTEYAQKGADYDKQMSKLDTDRREFETLKGELEDKAGAFDNIVSYAEAEPVAFISQLIEQTGDVTGTVSQVFAAVADQLDPALAEALGLDGGVLEQRAKQRETTSEVDTLKQELEQLKQQLSGRSEQEQQAQQQQQLVQHINAEFDRIAQVEGLTFADDQGRQQELRSLLQYAVDNGIKDNLEAAYAHRERARAREQKPAQQKVAERAKRRRRNAAVSTSKSASRSPAPAVPESWEAAAAEAFEELDL